MKKYFKGVEDTLGNRCPGYQSNIREHPPGKIGGKLERFRCNGLAAKPSKQADNDTGTKCSQAADDDHEKQRQVEKIASEAKSFFIAFFGSVFAEYGNKPRAHGPFRKKSAQ